jgi:hypothetical protein
LKVVLKENRDRALASELRMKHETFCNLTYKSTSAMIRQTARRFTEPLRPMKLTTEVLPRDRPEVKRLKC